MSQSAQDPQHDFGPSLERSGGVDFERDVNVSGDVVGRDKTVTVVGYSPKAVQRLLITVGALVFATAACFFSGGIVVGAVVFRQLDRPVNSSLAAAEAFERKLGTAQATGVGEQDVLRFTEEELSSYVRFVAGPRIGLDDARARLIEPGRVAIGGRLGELGNLNIAATFSLQYGSTQKVKLESAAVQVLPTAGAFGWVAVPNFVVAPFAERVDRELGSGYAFTGVQSIGGSAWAVAIEGQ